MTILLCGTIAVLLFFGVIYLRAVAVEILQVRVAINELTRHLAGKLVTRADD